MFSARRKTRNFLSTYLTLVENNKPIPKDLIAKTSKINIKNIGNSDELSNFLISRVMSGRFHHYFESSKHYTKFYKDQNREYVLRKHDNSFYIPNS